MSGEKFKREFLVFRQEDTGYGMGGKKPSGHMRIEIRGEKGRLDAFFTGLAALKQGFYRLCLLAGADDTGTRIASAGYVDAEGGDKHLIWEFNPLDIDGSGTAFENYDVAVLIVQNQVDEEKDIICPLVAFRNGEKSWRGCFRGNRNMGMGDEDLNGSTDKDQGEAANQGTEEEGGRESGPIYDDSSEISGEQKNEDEPANNGFSEKEADKDEQPGEEQDEPDNGSIEQESDGMGADNKDTENTKLDETETDDTATDNTEHNDTETESRKPDIEELFNRDFQKVDPFKSRRSDYNWWKVENPVHLSNILHRCDIKTPLLFNASVMSAYYRYKYLIAGLYHNREQGKSYLVCGVPGAYQVDTSPFGDMCRWIQVGGKRVRYGSMGYWLVYVDTGTGGIVKVQGNSGRG